MFARYHLYLDQALPDVSAAVGAWSGGVGPAVELRGGRALLRDAGVPPEGLPASPRGEMEIGRPTVADHVRGVVMPVRWRAVGGPPVLGDMEGDLSFEPYGAGRTQVTLTARYHPPPGRLGEVLDRAAVRRLADMVVRDCAMGVESWVDRLFHAG